MGEYIKASNYAVLCKENEIKYGSDIGRIGKMLLADRYAERTHFIFELLQNTEDALSKQQGSSNKIHTSIKFEITDDALSITHYGKPFDDKDVRGICGIAESTKDGNTAIGRFGIGFKSVYAFTDRPEIHSGSEHFAIENYVWPKGIPAIKLENNETRIILPLRTKSKAKDYHEIISGFKKIDLNSLLFLRYIEEIEWSANNGESGVFIRSKPKELCKNVRKIELIGQSNTRSYTNEQWLVFSKEISNEENKGVLEIAFLLINDKIHPISHSPLIVFFPTILQTYLGFLVQGPYRTTPSRDNIPTKDEWNQYCVGRTGELTVEALDWMKKNDFLNVEALHCLPINKLNFDDGKMFSPIFHIVKKAFMEKEFLPCYQGGYTFVQTALIAGTQEIRELFTLEQLFQLSGINYFWLSEDISQDKTPELRKYLMTEFNEPKTREIHPDTIISRINKGFLEKQSNKWICKFYEFLNGQKRLHERIKNIPIIRLSDLSHVEPFRDGQPQAFLPGKDTEFPTINKEVCKTKDALDFIRSIGLTEANQIDDVIRNILPKFNEPEKSFNEKTYKQAMERILSAYNIDSEIQKERLLNELRVRKIIAAIDASSGNMYYTLPNIVYFPTENLRRLFSGVQGIYFVHDEYGVKSERFRSLLESCGVARNLRLIKKEGIFTYQELELMRKNAGSIDKTWSKLDNDNSIHGLEELLKNFAALNIAEKKEKAKSLWKELNHLYERRRDSVFIGTYKWGYYSRIHSCTFDTYFIRLLNKAKWIPDRDGTLHKPAEIDFKDLGWENHEFLLSKIQFKLDEIQEFEEKTGHKVVPKDEYEEYLKWKESQINSKNDDKKTKENFIPSHSANDAPLKMSDYNGINKSTSFKNSLPNNKQQNSYENSGLENNSDNAENNDTDKNEHQEPNYNDKYIKDLGRWGEEYVLRILQEEFKDEYDTKNVEIIDLNAIGKPNEGADFIIIKKDSNTIVKLIEVKSTTDSRRAKSHQVSGNQWETARHHFNLNDGDLYWIYCVYNAGKENVEIVRVQNPIKKWKEGLLIADPVNFIIQ